MDLLESYYGKQTFFLYSLFAKVPGSKAWPRVIFTTLSVLLLSLTTVYQMIKLIVDKFRADVIIEVLPIIMAAIGILLYIPYVAFATEEKFMAMLSLMVNDLRVERSKEEDAIKRQYAQSAQMLINTLTVIFTLGFCSMPLAGFLPHFLDLLMPLNETRERRFLFNGEIFIDQEKYFYHIYVLQSCVVIVAGILVGVSENMSVIFGEHLCGMIAALGNRLENITRIAEHKVLGEDNYTLLVANRLKVRINEHQTILRFAFLIADFYNLPLTMALIGMFCTLTVSLVQITDPEMMSMTMIAFTTAQVFQLFLMSYMGQMGMDAVKGISEYAYNAPWYVCPVNSQKLLQLTILRASKPCLVVASGMYALTLANFMSYTKIAVYSVASVFR